MKQIRLIIVGAGDRGATYAEYARHHPDQLQIVAVAEPRSGHRNQMADEYNIDPANCFSDWRELIEKDIDADGVIIATSDADHREPAIAFAEKGCNILLEKPMAPSEQDCRDIVRAAEENGIIFAVCHVMRYTNYTTKLKEIIDSGAIGEVVTLQQFEPVGYFHQAHSFVRGNWGKEAESSFMLLAKCCHDLDWMRYIMGSRFRKVSSFGSLFYFKPENKPAGAGERCLDCSIEADCPYSAPGHYLKLLRGGDTGWPVSVVASEPTEEKVFAALRSGPYGRCVWGCDNDVVDHQVVNMEFEGGKSASLTMTAFADEAQRRKTRILGTLGQIEGDGFKIEVYSFKDNQWTTYDTASTESDIGRHGGGDYNIMKNFVAALAGNDPFLVLSGPAETLETHLATFAAERARLNSSVEDVVLIAQPSRQREARRDNRLVGVCIQ